MSSPSLAPVKARRLVPIGVAVGLAIALVSTLPASAHVTVGATSTEPGSFSRLTFAVPTESKDESTVRIEVALPEDVPFRSVRTVPVAGWDAQLTREDLPTPVDDGHGGTITQAVTRVVWTATEGNGIHPDQTGLFTIAVGPLPHDEQELYFPAVQTYDSGREVAWTQEATGGVEPDRPAPSIHVVEAGSETASGEDSHDTASAAADHATVEAATSDSTIARWALGLGGFGVLLGGAGLVIAIRGARRSRDIAT